MKSMVITGANGMLGSNLVRLFKDKYRIVALHRDDRCLIDGPADHSVDITDRNRVDRIMGEIDPDIIIHCAGLANVDQCEEHPDLAFDVNVRGTENLLAIGSDRTIFIYLSTDAVYGEADDHSENNLDLTQINQYARTKYLGEEAVRNSCDNHLVLRTNMFGWNIKPGRLSSAEWMYHSLRRGEELRLFTDYLFSPISIDNQGFGKVQFRKRVVTLMKEDPGLLHPSFVIVPGCKQAATGHLESHYCQYPDPHHPYGGYPVCPECIIHTVHHDRFHGLTSEGSSCG